MRVCRRVPLFLVLLLSITRLPGTGPRAADRQETSRELHVVGLYEGFTKTDRKVHGGKALVTVQRPGKRVTLVLTAYDSVTWEVTAGPSTQVEEVFLCGYHRQAVKGLPKGVKVVEAFREDRKGDLSLAFYTYRLDSPQFRALAEALHRKTGLKVSSFYGNYRAKLEEPIVVERVQDEPRLSPDWPTPTPLAELPRLTFKALHFTPGKFGHQLQVAYGDFTLNGPKVDSLKPAPKGVWRMTYDP